MCAKRVRFQILFVPYTILIKTIYLLESLDLQLDSFIIPCPENEGLYWGNVGLKHH